MSKETPLHMQSHILDFLRQRRGLEPDDDSQDSTIAAYQPERILREVCGWHLGDPSWAHTFLGWAKDAGYKITINGEEI